MPILPDVNCCLYPMQRQNASPAPGHGKKGDEPESVPLGVISTTNYQLDLRTPGSSPRRAMLRKQMRQMPN